MSIEFQRYTFNCTWTSEARLPEYLGSTLRGSLGWALKRTSCVLRHQNCLNCKLRPQCAYAWLFETERYTSPEGHAVNARPHPFVIEPCDDHSSLCRKGDTFTFSIRLIGAGNNHLPLLVYSVQLIGESGIGAGRRHGLGRFELEQVLAGGTEIYTRKGGVVKCNGTPLQLDLEGGEDRAVDELRLSCMTPLRVKSGNKLCRDLPFHVLVRASLRRVAALEYAYNGEEPDLDFAGLVDRAQNVSTTAAHLRWRELLRYSNRQKAKVSLGGIVGTATYSGDLTEFMPLLRYAEQVNIGKQTVFGLGRIAVEIQ